MKCEQIETLLHCTHVYRATLVVAHLGWVDFDFGSSSGCQILLELMGVWQNWLGRCLCGQHDGTSKSNSTQPRWAATRVPLYESMYFVKIGDKRQHSTKNYLAKMDGML